ncbi:hypothetical protein KJ762_02470 [bacterium]|nr:hypothetical protein [bacterium]MBU1065772.1 hypothetical protein [bacterium]MBU1633357.1 hypothetical protein [bacterium]MBU1875056.1 hypothetical protein [bacterium]
MNTTVNLEIFSPRWGHEDTYVVELDQSYMEIRMSARKTRATWRDNLDPEWNTRESIHDIMNNDSIYPPAIIQDLFEHAWLEWRNGNINDQQVNEELQEIATWLNTITRSKPRTDFWSKYF